MSPNVVPEKVNAIFLSDLHLGCRLSMAHGCLNVLDHIETKVIYLIGDVIDESRLRRSWHWPQEHQVVVDKLLELHSAGTEVYLTPGNHDNCFRNPVSLVESDRSNKLQRILLPLLDLRIAENFVHQLTNGKRLLVTHGDMFDNVDESLGGILELGSRVFDQVNWMFPRKLVLAVRWFFKLIFAKPDKIESAVLDEVKSRKLDGVIFGHLHRPDLKTVDQLVVGNCGDWVGNESFLVETSNGQLKLFNFGRQLAVQ